jgi:hypothetical protein
MDNAIKDMKTWAEASTWLERHGYGIEQIRLQKELWEAVPVPVKATVTPVKAVADKATITKAKG